MTVTNYVVPHEDFGDPRRLSVNNVDPDLFLSLLDEEDDNQQLTVTLCGHSSSGFRVRHEDTVVGMISAEQSKEYSELDWVMSSGLSPQVTATVGLNTDSDDDTTPVFEVLLPEPGLCVPSNNPPAERWGLLESDTALHVTDFDATHEALPDQSAHLLIRVDNKRGFAHRHIELSLDNVLIATIPRGEAKWLADSITAVNDDGLVAVSRAYYSVEGDAPTLTIFAGHDAPTGIPALRTAGIIAAATTAGTAAALVHSEAHGATSPAPLIGASAASDSASISLSSLDGAPPKAGFGAKVAGASTGLKLACAASVAVIIGGTANFAASVVSLSSSNELVTGSALETYEDPFISPRAAGAQDADEAEATNASDASESQEKYVTQDMKQERVWDAPSPLFDDEPDALDGSSDAGPAAALADEAPSESTATSGRADKNHEATASPNQLRRGDAAPTHRPSPSNRTRSTSNFDSSPLRPAERDTTARGATPSRQVKPKPRPTTPMATPTTQNTVTPPRTKHQAEPTPAKPPAERPTYLPDPHPSYEPRTPRPTPSDPIGQDRAAVGEDSSPIGQDRSATDYDRAVADQGRSPRIEDLIIVPFLPFLPPELLEPLPGTTTDIPQEPTPESETESAAPQEPTDPAPVTETEPSATSEAELEPEEELEPEAELEPKDELAAEDEPSVEPSASPSAEPSVEPLPEPEATDPTASPEQQDEWDERDEREENKHNSHIPPGQLKKMERENGPAPALRNR